MSETGLDLEDYYNEFKDFKYFFIKRWHGIKKYEIYKVWAQWLIRNLCKVEKNYHLIPSNQIVLNDEDILCHLKEKGADGCKIGQFYNLIMDRLSYLYRKYNQLKIDHITDPLKMMETNKLVQYGMIYNNGKQYHVYQYGRVYVKYCNYIHEKLVARYNGDIKCFRFIMFEMGFNYYMLEGHSFQWCVPPKAFTTIEKLLSAQTELFASPMNASLPHYYSLFYVDQFFGAIDNFFNVKPLSITEGTYEVNPPFIEYIFVESSKMVIDMLNNSQKNQKDLLFVYVMPNWLDSGGYQLLTKSEYMLDEIVLAENNHFYHQSSKHRMISANFETHILIIGTNLSKRRWTSEIRNKFIENFTHY